MFPFLERDDGHAGVLSYHEHQVQDIMSDDDTKMGQKLNVNDVRRGFNCHGYFTPRTTSPVVGDGDAESWTDRNGGETYMVSRPARMASRCGEADESAAIAMLRLYDLCVAARTEK